MCSVPAAGSVLNSSGLEGSYVVQSLGCCMSVCGCRWAPVVCYKTCPVEASQLPACGSQMKAVTRVPASYSCVFQHHHSLSLRSCEVSSVSCWGKAGLRKLLLHLNLKAVLCVI